MPEQRRSLVGFALLGLLPSCRFLQGRRVWADWQEIQKGDTFYVVLPYKQLGDVYLLAGLIGIVAVIYLALRGRRHVIGTVTAAVAFICAIIGPTVLYPSTPEYDTPIHARHGVARVMNGSLAALDQWTKQAGHLPASEAEFRDAVRDKVWLNRRSSYAYVGQPPPPSSQSKFDSQRLPYRLVFISGATGPHVLQSHEVDPAVVYIGISSDLRSAWLTGTGFERPKRVRNRATVIHTASYPRDQPRQRGIGGL